MFSIRNAAALVVCCLLLTATSLVGTAQETFDLERAPSPVDNPLKGLVPYARPHPDRFPHSMEFSYLPLSDLMKGEDQFDWQPMENLLNEIAGRGKQAVVRIFLEYPGKKKGIPSFLKAGGLEVHTYLNTNTAPFPPTEISTPDYENPKLVAALEAFIQAWGKAYDGDPRLGYVTAGLLGTWGEWHTYPREDLWASKATQERVLKAYDTAFLKTPILLRYPAGRDHYNQFENASLPFGYHDDSFCWATLDTGRKEDDWFYVPALKEAGVKALEKWKRHPIGGEIRPEVWGKIFDATDQWPEKAQPFDECVAQTHVSWLMDTGMFRELASQERRARAIEQVRKMGYDFHVSNATLDGQGNPGRCEIRLELINQGVAPFYADWPTEIAFADSEGTILSRQIVDTLSVKGLLPSKKSHVLKGSVPTNGTAGHCRVLMRVVQPLKGGRELRFANLEQGATLPGWLTLGTAMLP